MRNFCFLLFVLASCTVPDKASLRVMRETRKLRKSPVVLLAQAAENGTRDKLELRENNSFTYRSHLWGTQKITIYSGTFNRIADTLLLDFHNGHKDELWTGKAVIDSGANSITMLSINNSSNKRLTIERLN